MDFFFLISAGFLLLVMEKMFLLMFLGFANFANLSNFDGDFLTRSAYTLSFSIPKYKRR